MQSLDRSSIPRTPAVPDAPVPASPLRGHLPVLDGVRGLAILLLLFHQFVLPSSLTSPPVRVFEHVLQLGWVGVQLFFVLSGFLITGILLDTKGREGYFRSFYIRRILRIFPLYYLLLVTVSIIAPRLSHVPPELAADPWEIRLYWVYLSNWSQEGPDVLGSCWSLAVEEQFYLVWPFLVWVTSPRRLLLTCVALALLSLALRVVLRVEGVSPEVVYENTLTRVDALALGAALAVLLRDPKKAAWVKSHVGKALGVALAALAGASMTGLRRTGALTQTIGYSLLAVAFSLLLAVAVVEQAGASGRLARALSARPLRELGTYSYAMYLFQLPLHLLVSRVLLADVLTFRTDDRYLVVQSVYFAGMLGLTFGLAWLSYHLYEKRFLALKRYFQVK